MNVVTVSGHGAATREEGLDLADWHEWRWAVRRWAAIAAVEGWSFVDQESFTQTLETVDELMRFRQMDLHGGYGRTQRLSGIGEREIVI